jgi:hypothetical protein
MVKHDKLRRNFSSLETVVEEDLKVHDRRIEHVVGESNFSILRFLMARKTACSKYSSN